MSMFSLLLKVCFFISNKPNEPLMVFSDGLYAYSDIMTTQNELTVLLHLLMYFLLKEEDWFLSKQNQSILLDEDSSIIFFLESENCTL